MSAELLRQASAIYADTGLTPDDLLRQRAELLEALQAAMRFIDVHAADPDITAEMRKAWAELHRIDPHALIARATGETTT